MASMFLVLPFNVALIPRLVLYHSELWTEGAALARVANVNVSVGVAIRAGFTRSPGRYLFFLLAFPFVTCSIIFSNCERLVTPMYSSQHHAAWASYISLTTVGYGTDEAKTPCGRSVSMVLIILGIMVSHLQQVLQSDRLVPSGVFKSLAFMHSFKTRWLARRILLACCPSKQCTRVTHRAHRC